MNNQQENVMNDVTILNDESAFFTASFPLPKDHWIYAPRCTEWDSKRDVIADCPSPIVPVELREQVHAALRYAIRAATICGTDMDFDPDALVQNASYALCGSFLGTPIVSREGSLE